jgi:hypothetical protein
VFLPDKLFKPELIIGGKARNLPSKVAPLRYAVALLSNIAKSWKGLYGINTLAYLASLSVM